MDKCVKVVMSGTDEEFEKVSQLLLKNRQAMNTLFRLELGHECKISDMELIGDALHTQLSHTRSTIRIMLLQKQKRE